VGVDLGVRKQKKKVLAESLKSTSREDLINISWNLCFVGIELKIQKMDGCEVVKGGC
jgi:hypothetical protein